MHGFEFAEPGADAPHLPSDAEELRQMFEVPQRLEVLPDGRSAVVIGDPEGCRRFTHKQGDNPYGMKGTCGIVSCEDVLRRFGINVTEGTLAGYALRHDLCTVTPGRPELSGGTSAKDQERILRDHGVPARAVSGGTLERLAEQVGTGHGVIAEVNAGVLWNNVRHLGDGSSNHAITVTGVARDPASGKVLGFYINDSGRGDAGRFVDAAVMQQAWVKAGGMCVVTDGVRPAFAETPPHREVKPVPVPGPGAGPAPAPSGGVPGLSPDQLVQPAIGAVGGAAFTLLHQARRQAEQRGEPKPPAAPPSGAW